LRTAQIAALTSNQVVALETVDVAALKTAQVLALSTTNFAALTTDQIVALSTAQVAALSTAQIVALTTDQVVALETADVAALKTAQVAALETADFAALTTNQIVSLSTAQVVALSTAQIVALTTDQVVALETADVAALRTAQVAALATDDFAALSTVQVGVLGTAAIAALSTANINALTTSQLEALSTSQVRALTTNQIAALSTNSITALETRDVAVLRTAQVVALSTANIALLTTGQVAALTTGAVEALTTSQIAAFNTDQISFLQLGTPIVLDLNGDGVQTRSISAGVKFDLFGDGREVSTGFVDQIDGLLARDINGDGKINGGKELFGSGTDLANGKKAKDGYQALRELDSNQDGQITAADAAFNELRVFVDSNGDGVSQASEVKTLAELNIVKFDLQTTSTIEKNNGNIVGLKSSFQTGDGVNHEAADVLFVADRTPAPKPQEAVADMRSKVSGLAQAIGSFGAAAENGATAFAPNLNAAVNAFAAGGLATGLNVDRMVDALKQFDQNGKLIANPADALAATNNTTGLNGLQNPINGFLAMTK
jgi:hypothetical protein